MGDLHVVHLLLQYLASPTQTSRHIESRSLCRICPCVDYIVHAPFEVFFFVVVIFSLGSRIDEERSQLR